MADTTPIYLDEFKAMHPADLADRLQRMPTEEARHLLAELPVDTASATLPSRQCSILTPRTIRRPSCA